ncbi:MAG: putative porin [Gammaproteobacteria bacterium]|nr:MAG: putative porin [Gammaproteobacteria bacterium]
MKLKLFVAALGLAVSGFTVADSYQTEISGGFARFDIDGEDKLDTYNLRGVYHFKAVDTTNLPLAEASYLGKNSNVFADVIDIPKQDGMPSVQYYQVGAEFYIPENFLYVKGGVARTTTKGYRDNDWFTSIGITPIEGLLLTTDYYHDEGYDANIHAKYVTDIGNGQFVNVEAGIADEDEGTAITVGGDYYIDRTFSIGAEVSDADDDTSYTVRSRKFFTENFSGKVSYTDSDNENVINLGLAVRF